MKTKHLLLLAIALLFAAGAQAQTRYYVNVAALPGNTAEDATSWGRACVSLQAVINVAEAGDTVFVAAGVYRGGFFMKEGVQVYGGFKADGSETEYAHRTNPVDITVANLAGCSILDGIDATRVLTQLTPFTTETVWDGFVIRNGSVTGGKGAIVFNTAGTAPAGVIYRWDDDTHSGYMVGLEETQKKWAGYETDIPELPNITTYNAAKEDFSGSGSTALIVKTLLAGDYAAYWCDTLTPVVLVIGIYRPAENWTNYILKKLP